jgi:hypothetical protein
VTGCPGEKNPLFAAKPRFRELWGREKRGKGEKKRGKKKREREERRLLLLLQIMMVLMRYL